MDIKGNAEVVINNTVVASGTATVTLVGRPVGPFPITVPPMHTGWYDTSDGLETVRSYWNGSYFQADEADFGDNVSNRVSDWWGHDQPPEGSVSAAIKNALGPYADAISGDGVLT